MKVDARFYSLTKLTRENLKNCMFLFELSEWFNVSVSILRAFIDTIYLLTLFNRQYCGG